MAGHLRRTRILVAIILATIVFFTTRHYDALPPSPGWATKIPGSVQSGEAAVVSLFEHSGYVPHQSELVKEAHKLPNSDAFIAHFQAVTRVEGITMDQATATCNWDEGTKVNFQYGDAQEWVNKDRPDVEIDEKRKQWQAFVDNDMIPYASARNKFLGRGIVIVAGNQDTLKRVKVILRALLKVESKIPVEVHYWDDEMNDAMKEDLTKTYYHMFFNDLSKDHNVIRIQKTGIYINYQLKTAAVINSRFAEPLLLDSDNIPVVDPESLYDTEEYKEYGTLFWPDIARTRPQNPIWALTNTPCRMDEYEQESGQLLVNKMRYFYHLQLAAWFNNNQSDYYNEFLLGDKDMFRFAWHALQTQYGRPKKWLASVGTVNDGFFCGHTFAQHHPNGSVAFLHGGLIKTVDMEVLGWNRDTQGGYFRQYKRAQFDEDPLQSIDVGIKFDGADYKPDHTTDFHGAMCTDMYGFEPKDLDEIVPGFEKMFEEIGGYWMLETQKPVGDPDEPASTTSSDPNTALESVQQGAGSSNDQQRR